MNNLLFAKKAITANNPLTQKPPQNVNTVGYANSNNAFSTSSPSASPNTTASAVPFFPTGQPLNWTNIRLDLTRLGLELDQERVRLHLTKRDVARRTNMSAKTVGYVMKGWTQNIHKYIEVANALNLRFTLTK